MMRWLVLGATGTIGRELTSMILARGDSVVAAGRNPVLLDELRTRLGCETLQVDLADSATTLPPADVVVNLTLTAGRHPRLIVRNNERTMRVLTAYLDRHPRARLVHASTWVLIGGRPDQSSGVITALDWADTYRLGKSAAERALARAWKPGRMTIVRLGNVVTADSQWGVGLLRILRAGAVENPDALSTAANLSTVAELFDVAAHDGADVRLTNRVAGWTWGEVLEAIAAALVRRGTPVREQWASADPPGRSWDLSGPPGPDALLRRGLWLLPARFDTATPETLPAASRLVPLARIVLRQAAQLPISRLPPCLPIWSALPGGHDAGALGAMADQLADAYVERGYGD
jgi:nucleoside-diphosphate-sugar epimerase